MAGVTKRHTLGRLIYFSAVNAVGKAAISEEEVFSEF
jgi:hypothetical protein